jgi:2-polyprenyl-6-methoxyphenol hydroxylase-like FAD-dependent oxidoreductase
MGMNMAMRAAHHAAKHVAPLLQAGEATTAANLKPYEMAVRNFNEYVITASRMYGKVAAAKHQTHEDVARELEHSLALDPHAMSIVYSDYNAPVPTDRQIAALREGRYEAAA